MHVVEETGEYVDEGSKEKAEKFDNWRTGYRETQESSGTEVDPDEEARAALDAWKTIVGPSKGRRLPGTGGMGATVFPNSINPDLTGGSSETSTGRTHRGSDSSQVDLFNQRLEEQERKYQQQMEQMRINMQEEQRRFQEEQLRLNEERWKQFSDNMSAFQRPSMPSSSSSYFPQQQMQQMQQMQPMQSYGGGFQPYGAFQPSFQSPYQSFPSFNNSQPQQFHHQPQPTQPLQQPQQQSQPQQSQPQPEIDLNTNFDAWLTFPDPNISPSSGRFFDQDQHREQQ